MGIIQLFVSKIGWSQQSSSSKMAQILIKNPQEELPFSKRHPSLWQEKEMMKNYLRYFFHWALILLSNHPRCHPSIEKGQLLARLQRMFTPTPSTLMTIVQKP